MSGEKDYVIKGNFCCLKDQMRDITIRDFDVELKGSTQTLLYLLPLVLLMS